MSIGHCREGHTGKPQLCTGGDRGPHCPDVELDSVLAELLRLQTREPYKVSLPSCCHSGLATVPQGWRAAVSPHSSPALV